MTLTELAKLAHVSTSTASKAFSMSDEVNEQTRNLIFDTAKKHGCFKKFYRAEYPNCVIAVLCPEFESAYYSNLLSIMKRALAEVGAEMCVSEGGFSARPVDELIKYYDKFNTVDGIIVIGGYSESVAKHEIPIAVVGDEPKSADIVISPDISGAIDEAMKYFKERRVMRVGFVGDRYTSRRARLIKESARLYSMDFSECDSVIADDRFERGGYLGMKELISRDTPPRVVFMGYDRMAIGAMRAVYEAGLRIPEDIAIVGVDNDPQSEFLAPSLSSISHSGYEACRSAARELTNKIRGSEYRSFIKIDGSFILRESATIE